MEFFETVKQVASDVATVSAKQSKKLYIIAKLKLEMIEKQNIVKNLQKQIGIDAYAAYSQNEDVVNAIEDKLKKIDVVSEKITVLRKKVATIKTADDNENYDYDYDDETVELDDVLTEDDEDSEDEEYVEDDEEEIETEPID